VLKGIFTGGLLATVLAVSTVATWSPGAEAAGNIDARAAQAAQQSGKDAARNLIASRAPQLKVSANEKFSLAQPVISSDQGLQYAAYERTYKGLPVIGGDFVVTSNTRGQILGTSVAQKAKIGDLSTTAKVSKAAAARLAKRQLANARQTLESEKVVHALGSPRLAWKVRVSGLVPDGDRSVRDVYVDARSGKVIASDELLHFANGTGNGFFNGPSPLAIATTEVSTSSYSLKDPNIGSVDCRDDANGSVFTGSDNAWGDGTASSKETGCVDALFAIQTEDRMLADWLGRDSFDGSGNGWQIRVGKDEINAFYCPPGLVEAGYCNGTEWVRIGHNQANNKWLTTLDVVGHEYGHGIDQHTPGGHSGGNTSEFVADVFGAMTEAYANESTAYDEPDYLIGEEVDLVGQGAIRNMYNPSAVGDPNCYSSSIPNAEVHAAAGPGDHWFYLLAEGTNPVGKPASTTCNGSTNLAGIGIQKAGKIFYNAMLMKTSSSSYLKYRTWTLTAAKNLYPGSCAEFNAVKTAWTAVSVPAQTADPTCTVAGNTVTVTNPGNKTGTVGTAATLQLTGTSSGAGQTLTWSATGLPGGLSINATTGLISGTPTTAGTFTVTATAKDTTNAQGSTSFTWTVSPAGGGTTVTLANTIALSNCSASLVRYPSSVSTDRALMLTNGHCLPTMPTAGQVIQNQTVSRTGTLLKSDGTSAGTVTADKLIYATMTGTDISLYQLNETYGALNTRTGGSAITIADAKAATGTAFAIPSSYHKRIWDCTLNGFVNLKEGQWTFTDSIRYDADCDTIPGTSGSPIVSKADGRIIGINNTGNEDGAMCTLNNPCEVAADGTTTAHQGQSYGQQTWWITTCLNGSRQVDLTVAGCKLAGATTTPPPSGNLFKNPGFESGAVDWSGTSGVITSSTSKPARTGSWKAWLGGYGATATETLTQSVSVPATATTASLSFWIRIDSAETTSSTVYDTVKVQVVDGGTTSTLATYSNLNRNSTYVQKTFDLSAYKGKTVTVKFLMSEDSSLQTSFVVDDTAVTVS
jgi:Zn-dependent metalloprotease